MSIANGDVLFFHYNSKSSKPRKRFVRVNSVNRDNILATDLETDEHRSFTLSRMQDVVNVAGANDIVKPREEVEYELNMGKLSGPAIVKCLSNKDKTKNVRYFDKADAIIIEDKKIEPTIELGSGPYGSYAIFRNSDGNELILNHFNDLGAIAAYVQDKNKNCYKILTPAKILEKISSLF